MNVSKVLIDNYKHKNCIGSVTKVVKELTDGLDGIYISKDMALVLHNFVLTQTVEDGHWPFLLAFDREINDKYRKTSSTTLGETNT